MLNIVGNYSRSSPRCESGAGGCPNRDRTVAHGPAQKAAYDPIYRQTRTKRCFQGTAPAVRSSGRTVGGVPRTDTVGAP